MSRMVDGLGDAARAAGDSAAASLSGAGSIDVMEARIRRGVRRRRLALGAGAATVALAVGAGVVAAPQLLDARMDPAPAAPLVDDAPEAVRTDGAVTVYSDGSMAVLTEAGEIVDLPAPSPDGPAYALASPEAICSTDPAQRALGWDHASPEAQRLLGHGRPQYVNDDYERITAVQGQQLPPDRFGDLPDLAFEVEATPAVAENIALRATTIVQWEEQSVGYATQLDGDPRIAVTGGNEAPRIAVAQMRALPGKSHGYCGTPTGEHDWDGVHVTRYLVVDAYLIDHAGSATLLGTHTSWTGTEITQ